MFRTNRSNYFVNDVKCQVMQHKGCYVYPGENCRWLGGPFLSSSLLGEGFLCLTAMASLTRRLMVLFLSLFIKKGVHMGFVLPLWLNTNYYTYETGYFLTI